MESDDPMGTTKDENVTGRRENQASRRPAMMPPFVNSSGRMRSSKSVAINSRLMDPNKASLAASSVGPKRYTIRKYIIPQSNSTKIYRIGMAYPHFRHLPRRSR